MSGTLYNYGGRRLTLPLTLPGTTSSRPAASLIRSHEFPIFGSMPWINANVFVYTSVMCQQGPRCRPESDEMTMSANHNR